MPAALLVLLGGCSLPDFDSLRTPSMGALRLPSFSTPPTQAPVRPITPDDLVSADGACAAAAPEAANVEGGGSPQPALISGGIGLDMPECEVVRRAGRPDRVEIGTTERGERSVMMTFTQGPRPGIYRFTAGRLAAMERGAEPPPAPKPARKPPPKVAKKPPPPKPVSQGAAAPWPNRPAPAAGSAATAPWPAPQQAGQTPAPWPTTR